MKAVIYTRYGSPDVLKIAEIPKPEPRDKEILIRIRTTTVTVADCRVRGFRVPPSFWLPARLALGITGPRKTILGAELAGVVEKTGKGVTRFKAGDEVFAYRGSEFGTYAEYICMNENSLIVPKPGNLSFTEAAALPLGATTALCFLQKGKVRAGEKVLIYGASGSVGTYAVQFAKHFGARVTGVCSTANTDLVKSLGAESVIDYTRTDFTTLQEKYDVIFDTVGKADVMGTINSLQPEGRYLHAVTDPFNAIGIRRKLKGSQKKLVDGTFKPTTEQIELIRKLAEEGVLKAVIDREYALEDIAAAHTYVDQGHKKGNVGIRVS